MSAAIKIYNAVVGTCYNHKDDNRYLGKFLKIGVRSRKNTAGVSVGQPSAPVYEFENETIKDNYPSDMVIPVACNSSEPSFATVNKLPTTLNKKGGRRKTSRRSKNSRSKYSRRRKSQ